MQTLNVANELNSTNTSQKDTVELQQSVSSKQDTEKKIVDPYIHCGFAHSLVPQAELPEFEEGARLKFALKAYDNEELSTGLAARFAGMSREEFIYTMGKYGISPIRLTVEELRKDIESARKASHQ